MGEYITLENGKREIHQIVKIENFPESTEFVTEKKFIKEYVNRTITFHYRIEY